MSVTVHFINKSGERVRLYESGGILKILEPGKRFNRDPAEGTLRTTVVMDTQMKFPPPGAKPYWIDKVEWLWEECPESSMYAPYRTIVFLDGNEVKLKKRPGWKPPELKWPVVTFLFKSRKMKILRERLDREAGEARVFHNGIPIRITVHPLSRYAPFKNWIFEEVLAQKDKNPYGGALMQEFEMIGRGEGKRSATELEKIAELKVKDEERRKLGLF